MMSRMIQSVVVATVIATGMSVEANRGVRRASWVGWGEEEVVDSGDEEHYYSYGKSGKGSKGGSYGGKSGKGSKGGYGYGGGYGSGSGDYEPVHEPEASGDWEPEHYEPEHHESDDYYVSYGKSGKGSKGSKGGYGGYVSGGGHDSDWSAPESDEHYYSYGKSGKGGKGSKGGYGGYGSGDGHYYEPEPEHVYNSGSGDGSWNGDGYW